MNIMNYTMQQMAGALSTAGTYAGGLEALPIVDETGLTGAFEITLTVPATLAQFGSMSAEDRASVWFAAVQQIGLKLVPKRAPVEVIVIDRVERPSAN